MNILSILLQIEYAEAVDEYIPAEAASGTQWSFWIMTIIIALIIWVIVRAIKKRSNKQKNVKAGAQGANSNVAMVGENDKYIMCPSCGAKNLPDSKFCSTCGKEMPKVCPDCGEHIASNAKFCPKCGKKL